jgi:hypothetical protein
MRLKDDTVRIQGITTELKFGLDVASYVYEKHGKELVITSGSEFSTRHSETSLHYSGNAVDLRTSYFRSGEVDIVKAEIKERLGRDFDVVIESTHIHLEYQPKRD